MSLHFLIGNELQKRCKELNKLFKVDKNTHDNKVNMMSSLKLLVNFAT